MLVPMSDKAMSNRRRFIWPGAAGAFFGGMSFFRVIGNSRFQTYHALDVIGLMTAGAGFALAIVMLVMFVTGGPRAADK